MRLLRFRDVAHDAQHAAVLDADESRFEVARLLHRQVELDDHRLVGLAGAFERAIEDLGLCRRHDFAHRAADELLGRHEEQLRVARVVVHVGAVAQEHEHQVGDGAEHGAVARLELAERFLARF